ncbi:hypothetical protein M5689_012227 [Euphorbia peplus]|nr:hypothetical protein M5689_012227 [Euphorbia peplus]
MNTLVRNATTTLSRRRVNSYELLNIARKTPNSKSKNANSSPVNNVTSHGYRVARSKQRQIFLQSYTLASKSRLKRPGKLRKAAVKVRTVVVLFVSFLRFGGSRNCGSRSEICASSPRRVSRFG